MKYTKFTIENYKGIKNLELDLAIQPDHKIYTLIGLNESGKTTILEAINDFEFEVPAAEKHKLIPKSSAGGFTGDVAIKATLAFSEADKTKIINFVKDKAKFKEIWRKENPGQDIDDATAMDQAVALLTLMDTVYKPVKKEWLEKYKDEVDEENSADKGGVK